MDKYKSSPSLLVLLTLIILLILIFLGSIVGILLLGVVLVLVSLYLFINVDNIWSDAKKNYKKMPKSKQNSWNEPKELYYQINRFIILPVFLATGSLLIYSYWILR